MVVSPLRFKSPRDLKLVVDIHVTMGASEAKIPVVQRPSRQHASMVLLRYHAAYPTNAMCRAFNAAEFDTIIRITILYLHCLKIRVTY